MAKGFGGMGGMNMNALMKQMCIRDRFYCYIQRTFFKTPISHKACSFVYCGNFRMAKRVFLTVPQIMTSSYNFIFINYYAAYRCV